MVFLWQVLLWGLPRADLACLALASMVGEDVGDADADALDSTTLRILQISQWEKEKVALAHFSTWCSRIAQRKNISLPTSVKRSPKEKFGSWRRSPSKIVPRKNFLTDVRQRLPKEKFGSWWRSPSKIAPRGYVINIITIRRVSTIWVKH